MNSRQYTIRSIPPKLDGVLRSKAKKTGKSLNEVTLDALTKGVGLSKDPLSFSDLDWFIGSCKIDTRSIDETQAWLDSLPNNLDTP